MVITSLKKSIRKNIYPKLNKSIETLTIFFTVQHRQKSLNLECCATTRTPTKGVFGFRLQHPN